MAKKHHFFTSLRKTEQNIFVPFGLATGVFEELPLVVSNSQGLSMDENLPSLRATTTL